MKTEKKLYRVDINLKYLVLAGDEDLAGDEYNQSHVFDWLKHEMHEGELTEGCTISQVDNTKQIEDFDEDYSLYCVCPNDKDREPNLNEVIDLLGLDAKKMIERLKKLGYKVTKK